MAWPTTAPPNNRLNTTPTVDNHPSDHNMLADAIVDIANVLGGDPAGTYTDIQDRLDAIEFELRPPGEFMHFAGSQPPGRWLNCVGGEYNRAAPYDKLFAAIGDKWGKGNGTTTFNVPSLAGRTLFAVGGSGATATLGKQDYGSANGIVPTHSHSLNGHSHSIAHAHNIDHTHAISGTAADAGQHGHNLGHGTQIWWVDPNGWKLPNGIVAEGNTGFPMAAAQWLHDGTHRHAVSGGTGGASPSGSGGSDTPSSGGPSSDSTSTVGAALTDINLPPGANCTIWIRY